ncbi:WhiB family transcriptional regulator [Microbispora amethystogenes]|uniref:WhiB family transcriptional regulator n=1 Tax=Microbispora amethystogenes TaxID=1427754 RepID=UPI0034078716
MSNGAERIRRLVEQMGLLAEWREQAACKGMAGSRAAGRPNVMYPGFGDEAAVRRAKQVCWDCLVLIECRRWADSLPREMDRSGEVIAGLTSHERAERRRKRQH